jgi:hypothetical protein
MGSFSMTASCHPLPRNVVEEMLQLVGRAICDRPGETAAQREGRTNQMVHSTLGFAPRDGLEFMLAGLAIGHFNLILDSMRDVFRGQLVDQLKAKTKTTIVALDRAMLEMIKELRVESLRPVAQSLGDVVAAPLPMPEDPQLAAAAADSSRQADTAVANPEPVASAIREVASNPAPTSTPGSLQPGDTNANLATPATQRSLSGEGDPSSQVTADPELPEWTDEDEAALRKLIAANDAALAAANESIAEAWGEHNVQAAAASAD